MFKVTRLPNPGQDKSLPFPELPGRKKRLRAVKEGRQAAEKKQKGLNIVTLPDALWDVIFKFFDASENAENIQLTCKSLCHAWERSIAPPNHLTHFNLNSPNPFASMGNSFELFRGQDKSEWVDETFGLLLLKRFGNSRVSLTGIIDLRWEDNETLYSFSKWLNTSPELLYEAQVWVQKNQVVGLYGIDLEIYWESRQERLERALSFDRDRSYKFKILSFGAFAITRRNLVFLRKFDHLLAISFEHQMMGALLPESIQTFSEAGEISVRISGEFCSLATSNRV